MNEITITTILNDIGNFMTWLLTKITATLSSLVANPYFQLAIVLCLVTVVIGIILKFFKSFGLKRGKRRGR